MRGFKNFKGSDARCPSIHFLFYDPANRADSILSPLMGLKYPVELKLKGIAALSNMKACHQAK